MGDELTNELEVEDVVSETENDEELEDELDDETREDEELEEGLGDEDNTEEEDTSKDLPKTFTQEQVEHIVKGRVASLTKKIEKTKTYESTLKRICDITGLGVEELSSRLEQMSDAQQAKILGITPEQVAQRRAQLNSQAALDKSNRELGRRLEETELKVDPKYRDFDLFKDDVYDIMDENPKLTMKQAYTLVKGDVGVKAAARDAEQRAVARMSKSISQGTVKPGASKAKSSPKIDPSIVAAAKQVGMDPAEYAAYSGISDLDGYERMIKKKG